MVGKYAGVDPARADIACAPAIGDAPWHRFVGAALLFGASLTLSLEAVKMLSWTSAVWLTPGILAGVLLRASPLRAWAYLAAYVAAGIVVFSVYGYTPLSTATRLAATAVEGLIVAAVVRRDADWLDGASDALAAWGRFVGVAFAAPAVGALAGAVVVVVDRGVDYTVAYRGWYVAHTLALCVVVPLILRLHPHQIARLHAVGRLREAVLWLAMLALVAAAALSQPDVSALLLPTLLLVALTLRVGFAGVVAGMAILTAVTVAVLYAGTGPFHAIAPGVHWSATLLSQGFLLATFCALVLVAALNEERQRANHLAELSEDVYRAMAEASGDLVLVWDEHGHCDFVSSAAHATLRVPARRLLDTGWRALLYADDAASLDRLFDELRHGRGTADAVFRLRGGDGDLRWFEARGRAVRRGRALRIVATVRDVTERMQREVQFAERNARLETLVTTDPLTGIANRYWYAEALAIAWRNAARDAAPLSLLVVDIDDFRKYNDAYGHAAGDCCIQAVAECLLGATEDARDFCARYGGEEFVVLLPGRTNPEALAIAERIRASVAALELPHAGSARGIMTVSVGAATRIPGADHEDVLFEAADFALHRAKHGGRNRVENHAGETISR